MKKIFVLFFFLLACEDFPHDPGESWKIAKKSKLIVGVTENPPFTIEEENHFSGIEIELIEDFARQENLEVSFLRGSESELIKKLEKYEIHLLLGGFDKKTLWKRKATPSASYDHKHVILVPKGENKLLQELETFILKNRQHENH